jgi:hypothetical protein
MKQLAALLFIVILMNSCKKDDEIAGLSPNEKAVALFSYDVISKIDSPNIYKFNNLSTGATKFKWYFGESDSSDAFEPSFKFRKNGSYKIVLVASNASSTNTKSNLIHVTNILEVDTNNIDTTIKPKAIFKLYYDLDAAHIVRFKNLSTDFETCTWVFGDNTTSNEINPIHSYLTLRNGMDIKLIVENKNHKKDSLTLFYFPSSLTGSDEPERLLISTKPVIYSIVQQQYYTNRNTFTHISYTDEYTENPEPRQATNIHTFDDLLPHNYFIYIYSYGNDIIGYKKYTTMDLSNISTLFSNISGNYTFNHRVKIETNSFSTHIDSVVYSDTTLNVSFAYNGMINIHDDNIGHNFNAYLSSKSTSSNYIFYIDEQFSPTLGAYINTYIKVSNQFNRINLTYTNSYGTKVSGTTKIIYNGTR